MAGNGGLFPPLGGEGTTSVLMSRQQKINNADDVTSKMVQDFRNAMNHLSQLWDQVHLDTAARAARVEQACELVRNHLRDIVESEEQTIRNIATDLEARRNAVTDLRRLFNQPPFDESLFPAGSVALWKALDAEMGRLAKKRENLMAKQQEYFGRYEMLCQRLGVPPEDILGVHERIFTDVELNTLRDKVSGLKSVFTKRLQQTSQLQHEAKKIFEATQLPTNNSIGEEELQMLKLDLHSPDVLLSTELLDRLTALNQRLKDHYDSWIEQVAFRYDELLVKLDELSKKCFRPPVSNDYPENIDPEQLNEKQLQKLENELSARQELYARAQPVFDKLNEWMAAWTQKLDTERRVCRASFYKNRAGSLNSKLKQRRMIDQQVPKLFNELHQLCEEYVKNYRVYDILVEGLRADKYAEHQMKHYEQDREMQRAQRQISTSRIPQTPGRTRNVFATSTPSRQQMMTPNRQQATTPARQTIRKLKMPATVGTMSTRKRSFSCTSQLSSIHPLQSPVSYPRTSSPKSTLSHQ